MSDRMYIVCNDGYTDCDESNEKKVIAKRSGPSCNWSFCCAMPQKPLNDWTEKLLAKLDNAELDEEEKDTIRGVLAFNDWLSSHPTCRDFSIEMEV